MKNLRSAGNYNRSLIEANIDPLVTIGPDGRITDMNNSTEQLQVMLVMSLSVLIFRIISPSLKRPAKVTSWFSSKVL